MKSGAASQKKLSESAVDFPRINENYTGRSVVSINKNFRQFSINAAYVWLYKMLGYEHLHLSFIYFASTLVHEF